MRDLTDRYEFCHRVFHHRSKFPHLTLKEAFDSTRTLYRIEDRPLPFIGVSRRAYQTFHRFSTRHNLTAIHKSMRGIELWEIPLKSVYSRGVHFGKGEPSFGSVKHGPKEFNSFGCEEYGLERSILWKLTTKQVREYIELCRKERKGGR